jgi:LysR family transcriptional regulator for bpeEF and oprC
VQVVDAGGFTKAADSMRLPKATVSTLVRDLETTLAVKLLNRTTRQISLTADGAVYYERCVSILADVRDAEHVLSKTHASPSGRLRVDVPASLGRRLILPALGEFFRRYPDINIEVGCSDRPVDLIEEGVDCALRGGDLADSTMIARRVGSVRLVTCASPDYLARHGSPMHPQDLMQHQCINYFSSRTGKICEWDFARMDEKLQLKVPGRVALNDSDACLDACLSGLGIAQMASYSVQPHLESGKLALILDDWCVGAIPLHVIYPQNRHLSAKVRVFVEWVAELLADQPSLQTRVFNCAQSDAAQSTPASSLRGPLASEQNEVEPVAVQKPIKKRLPASTPA